jgi:ornithine decarboxylase
MPLYFCGWKERLSVNPISIVAKRHEAPYRQLLEQYGSPLLVLDCAVLRQCYRDLKKALPGVGLYYAIKSLPEKSALATLTQEGAGFDVATNGELDLLRSIGANPAVTIHTHPIKRDSDIFTALQFGCSTFVVDNIDELLKFKNYHSRVEILLRISFRSKDAACDLSRKFGCSPKDVPYLLTEAAKLGIRVKGLSFHVGSQSLSSDAHVDAINACKTFYNSSALVGVANLEVLDIGGGFPVDYAQQGFDLNEFCKPIHAAMQGYPEHVRFIAEPGRVLSAPAMISISTVIGRAERAGLSWYYLDDGVYGAYSGQIYDHAHYPLTIFSDATTTKASVLAGPTCDSIDVITERASLPPMNIGDIVLGEFMGAYTLATAGEFNSIPKPKLLVVNYEQTREENVRYLYAD